MLQVTIFQIFLGENMTLGNVLVGLIFCSTFLIVSFYEL